MKFGWLALFLAPAIFSSAQAADEKLAKAESVYKQFCSHCHGLKMVSPGTSSYDLRKFPLDQKERFYTSVKKGKKDMPAWGDILTEQELDQLWYYVATRAGKEALSEEKADVPAKKQFASFKTIKPGVLTVCIARNGGIMSGWRHDGGTGLDYDLSAELAERIGLKLEPVWFESEQEEESDPVKESYAMLSYGLCDAVPLSLIHI